MCLVRLNLQRRSLQVCCRRTILGWPHAVDSFNLLRFERFRVVGAAIEHRSKLFDDGRELKTLEIRHAISTSETGTKTCAHFSEW